MTEKEAIIQRALGLLDAYNFIMEMPAVAPADDTRTQETITIEAVNLDAAIELLTTHVMSKYPHVDNISVDRTPTGPW